MAFEYRFHKSPNYVVTLSNFNGLAQYNAWCRNDGEHRTEKRGYVNWNADLIWKMRAELAFQWETLEEEIPTLFANILQSTKIPLLELQSAIRGKLIKAPEILLRCIN